MKPLTDLTPAGVHPSQGANGHGAATPDKWHLLRVVERAREPLGLKSTTLNILRAMLSFMREDTIGRHQDDAHICFASNATLAERAHVSIQTVERHIARLVETGLVTRVASGNKKRWARRDRQGRVVLAAGLSVLPLRERHDEFVDLADAQDALQERRSLLRDRCLLALSRLREKLGASFDLCQEAARLLRRKLDERALTNLLDRLCAENPVDKNLAAEKMRGSAPQIEGHKETNNNPVVQKAGKQDASISATEMEAAFPKLCKELRTARTPAECHDRMDRIALYLGLGKGWHSIRTLGPTPSFLLLGYLYERTDKIANPVAYVNALVRDLANGRMTLRNLLPRRKEPGRYAERVRFS